MKSTIELAFKTCAFKAIPDVKYSLLSGEFVFTENQLQTFRDLCVADERKELEELQSKVCDECDGDGWQYFRDEGKVPCVCVTEMEPYQLLQDELEAAKAQIVMKDEALHNIMEDQRNEENRYVFLTAKQALSATSESTEAWLRERDAKVFSKVIKFGASEREARLVFANIQDRDNFLTLLVGAELRAKNGG
ncbi:MAG TPA: hypothetical protein VK149_12040 [Sideroxyarcus sp.]|nr:hypothetical protein [Sideroxyarcus sp.]